MMTHLFITILTSLCLLLGHGGITPVSAALPVYTVEAANEAISSEIGTQAKVGELTDGEHGIGTATQLGLHALTGCASAALQSGDCGAGALGQVTGEVVGMLYNENTDMADIDGDGYISDSEESVWRDKGVELAGTVTQAVLTATGADAHDIAIGTTNGTIAAENNALCGGVCVGAAMVAVAAYLTAEGDGNPLDGLGKVGAGEDTVSTAVGEAVEAGVRYSAEHYPEETAATLGVLETAGDAVDATVSFVDDATGNVVSKKWNELPPETQDRLKGAGAIVSIVIPGASAKILTKTPEVDKMPEVGNDVDDAVDRQKTYQTYTKRNPETGEVYCGRTSGCGNPLQNVDDRDRNHHKNADGFGEAELEKSSTNKDAIRGHEQQLIEQYGGAKSQGGTSGNAINGISPNNPKRDHYLDAATKEFGNTK